MEAGKFYIPGAPGRWLVLRSEDGLYFYYMKLHIKFSGGMGISYQGSVDLSTLPKNLYEKLSETLSEKNLSNICTKNRNHFTTDAITYELQLDSNGQIFSIDESQASNDMLDLIDNLQPYLNLEPK